MERSLAGETEAFHGLVERYRDPLYRLVYRFLPNHHDALEISQETFARAWEKLGTFDTARSFRVWLFSIGANQARDLIRKRGRRGLVHSDDLLAGAAGGGSPEAAASISEESERLRAAVDRLPDEKRLAVVLRYFEGMSIAEMEEITGEGRSTLKVRLFRARKDLLRMLDGKDGLHE
ncbi:MAG: sigma-70 family RNA polymerase sigma factor [Planctomycetota bacterium]